MYKTEVRPRMGARTRVSANEGLNGHDGEVGQLARRRWADDGLL